MRLGRHRLAILSPSMARKRPLSTDNRSPAPQNALPSAMITCTSIAETGDRSRQSVVVFVPDKFTNYLASCRKAMFKPGMGCHLFSG